MNNKGAVRIGLFVTPALFIALIFTGCGSVGMMISKTETFRGNDSLVLSTPKPDILDVVARVGKSIGYSVSSLDKEAGTVGLAFKTSLFTGVMIGKITHATLTIISVDNGTKLNIRVMLMGNFGTGGQDAAIQLINDFKAKLLEKIRQ